MWYFKQENNVDNDICFSDETFFETYESYIEKKPRRITNQELQNLSWMISWQVASWMIKLLQALKRCTPFVGNIDFI